MKRFIKNILPAVALAFILLIPGIKAVAGTISSVDATAKDNTITVSGVADSGVLSVAVFLYDESGETMIQMKSVAVDSDMKFKETFEAANGTYMEKAAD